MDSRRGEWVIPKNTPFRMERMGDRVRVITGQWKSGTLFWGWGMLLDQVSVLLLEERDSSGYFPSRLLVLPSGTSFHFYFPPEPSWGLWFFPLPSLVDCVIAQHIYCPFLWDHHHYGRVDYKHLSSSSVANCVL